MIRTSFNQIGNIRFGPRLSSAIEGWVYTDGNLGSAMTQITKSGRRSVMFTLAAVAVIGGLMVILLQRSAFRSLGGGGGATVIRRPGATALSEPTDRAISTSIAPMATVTVSSTTGSGSQFGQGVADGVVDRNNWVAQSETSGAWIRLDWDRAATIHEIDLFDLPDPDNNVLSGTLTFDDGSTMAVDALPPTGVARRITFPAKVVHSLKFRIDQVHGPVTGLAEIMVMGTLER